MIVVKFHSYFVDLFDTKIIKIEALPHKNALKLLIEEIDQNSQRKKRFQKRPLMYNMVESEDQFLY